MTISIIAAVASNGVIGRGNQLPWRLPSDLRRFRALTTGHAVIMGRRTFESIGRPLPNRTNIVLSRSGAALPESVVRVASLAEGLRAVPADREAFVIGGHSLFQEALPIADRLCLTEIDCPFDGDVHFPPWSRADWELVSEERQDPDANHECGYWFRVYTRLQGDHL